MQKNKIKEFIKKYEFLFTGLIVMLFVFFLTINLMIPNIKKSREIFEGKQLLKQKLIKLEKKNSLILSIDERNLKDNYVKLNYIIPQNKDYSLLFTTLDSLQEKSGIAITRTDFELGTVSTSSAFLKKSANNEDFSIPVTLEVIGSFDQVQIFLSQLSDLSGRLITVDQIKLQFTDFTVVKAAITGKTYFNPLPKTIGGVETPLPEFNQNIESLFKTIKDNNYPVDSIENQYQEVPVGKENLFL